MENPVLKIFKPFSFRSADSPAGISLTRLPKMSYKTKHTFTSSALSLAALIGILSPLTAVAETPISINMKFLVVTADGKEPSFAAITSVLDQINAPYDVLIASTAPASLKLSDGLGNGYYQGIVLTTGNLAYQAANGDWQSAFTSAVATASAL